MPPPGFLRIAFVVMFTCAAAFAEARECRTVINVTDNYGGRVQADHIRLTSDDGVSEVQQDEPFQAKCGQHTLDIEVRGFRPQSLRIDIDQVQQIVTAAMRLGPVDGPVPDCSIMGRIAGPREVQRVRLLQLFGPYLVDVPVTAAKSFRFVGIECGTYLLVAMSAKHCLGTQTAAATVSGTHVDLKAGDANMDHCSSSGP